uniref:Uncharacterized protein n=1 Tax=Grammatophora oceanica TaxID=210454 RepID=A0A7S1V206_9STRA|mmetsp:Transcript_34622/g.51409  ORF Transcript_34622/g.51409 Transcript_34622/m.51409 type:complete len:426 (+) Transcript_34622:1-1278(+)
MIVYTPQLTQLYFATCTCPCRMQLRKGSPDHEFKTLTLRELYNYVLKCIATRPVDLLPAVVTDCISYPSLEVVEQQDGFDDGSSSARRSTRRPTVMAPDDGLLPIPSLIQSTKPTVLRKTSSSFLSTSDSEPIQEGNEEDEEVEADNPCPRPEPADIHCAPILVDQSLQQPPLPLNPALRNESEDNNLTKHTRHVSFIDTKPTRTRMFKRSVSVGDTENDVSGPSLLPLRSPAPLKQLSTLTESSMGEGGAGISGSTPVMAPPKKRARLGGYLHPRDMRRLVTPFSSSNEPELIVRRHVMLLNFDPLRAIVLRDRLLVLVPDGADSILGSLAKRVRGGLAEVEDSVFGSEHSSSEQQQTSSETGTPKGSNQKLNNPDDDVPNETSGAGDRPVLARVLPIERCKQEAKFSDPLDERRSIQMRRFEC